MNRSIGIYANALPHLRHGREGLPVAFIIRTVLEQKNGKSAIAFLKSIRHASGQNYVLGAGDSVYDFECSAGKVAPFAPVRGGAVVYHTNHPLANDDYDEGFIAHLKRVDPAGRAMDGTQARFAALERRLKNRKEGMRIEAIEEVLRSRDSERYPVCVPLRGTTPAFTFGSTIMQLSAEPEFRVSAGPPDVNAYQAFRFR